MKRSDLEHVLRASKAITGEAEFIVIGSQSILGSFPDAPRELRQSMEADLYPKLRPDLAAHIEGSLGRYSPFEETYGYYADGVSRHQPMAPPVLSLATATSRSSQPRGRVAVSGLILTTSRSASLLPAGRRTLPMSPACCASRWFDHLAWRP
jgi:hypothetical protein